MQLTTTGSSKAFIFDESGNTTTLTDNRKLQLAGFYVPIAHEIHLKSNSEFHFPYTTLLYDINGKRHGTFIISERNPTIKLPPLPPGIYLVYVVEKVTNATGTIKFIIP